MHHGPVSPEIAAGLLVLRERIAAAKIPPSKLDESINIAVWNIREFGKVHRTEPARFGLTLCAFFPTKPAEREFQCVPAAPT